MSLTPVFALCVGAFVAGGTFGFLVAAMLAAGARSDKQSSGFH